MTPHTDTRQTLLLVDDEAVNLNVLRHTFGETYRLLFAKNGFKALELARLNRPDLILLDIMMPDLSGYEVCRLLKEDPATASIPVIFVTALAEADNEAQGLNLGAVDYIGKPFNPHIVRVRVRTHLSLVQSQELRDTRLRLIQSLGLAAEFKDNETGLHVVRISHYARTLARAVGYDEGAAADLFHAAPLHDVGKIGIPDAVLLKPGKLTPDEWRVMRQHTEIGAKIIGDHPGGLLRMAAVIALNHHEKWDGSGYPAGIAGEGIPHVARVVAVADVFDALVSVRPYKPAWPVSEALELIRNEAGRHFDPQLAAAFLDCAPEILRIREHWAEPDGGTVPSPDLPAA